MRNRFLWSFVFGMLAAALTGWSGQLEVGASTVDITPERGFDQMVGMNRQATVVEKVHDPLFAKAIVFQNGTKRVALVTLDLIIMDGVHLEQIRKEVEEKTGIANVICSMTHTHGSGMPTEEVSKKMVAQAVEAVVTASKDVEPARIGFGRGEVKEGYNRRSVKADGTVEMLWNNSDRRPTAPVDDDVGVISIQRVSDGSTIATLVNYAVHPVISMNFKELVVSADYPGAMARKLEERLGGTCIFFMGASGDINPYDAGMFDFATAEEVFTSIDRLAEALAAEIEQVVKKIEPSHSDASLDFDAYRLNLGKRENGPHGDKDQSVEVDTFLIAKQFAFATIPGELFVELGLDLKERSPVAATFVVSCANSYCGYLPTIKAAREGGYGASSATFLEVGAGELMVHQAIVSLNQQMNLIKPLQAR